MVRKYKVVLVLFMCASFFSTYNVGEAEVFSSSNFQVLDPVVNVGAGRSTSTSFRLLQSFGELSLGTSTAASFQLNPGFLTFPTTTIPSVTASAGDGQVSLSWTAATGQLGWTVSGYTIGQSTTSGGPYSYSSVGSVTSSSRTGLSNGTTYYFVVNPEDTFGNIIATSTEVSSTPVAGVTPPPGGGGGGGIGIIPPATLIGSILLEGVAYPNAFVNILLDGENKARFRVEDDSLISKTIEAESGSRSVGIFAEDGKGRKSLTFTFSVFVLGTAETKVSGIILPPTIDLNASDEDPRTLIVDGSSFTQAVVSLLFNSRHELIREVDIAEDGFWDYNLDTTVLETGDHIVRAKNDKGG